MSESPILDAYDSAVTSDEYVRLSPISASMVGICRRQGAYALTLGWPEASEPGHPTAYLGGAIHERLLEDLKVLLGGEIELEVKWDSGTGIVVSGHADLDREEGVIDVKTVSNNYYPTMLRDNGKREHRWQVAIYAMAQGRTKAHLLYVNRDTGDRFLVDVNPAEVVTEIKGWLYEAQQPPEDLPRDQPGPGLSFHCDHCPFKVPCWGEPEEGRLPQSIVANEQGMALALEAYHVASIAVKVAKQDQEFWRAALEGAKEGQYGSWSLQWRGSGKSTWVLDPKAAEEILLAEDLFVPKMEKKGSRSIDVRPS